jgi:hypothetical protein
LFDDETNHGLSLEDIQEHQVTYLNSIIIMGTYYKSKNKQGS